MSRWAIEGLDEGLAVRFRVDQQLQQAVASGEECHHPSGILPTQAFNRIEGLGRQVDSPLPPLALGRNALLLDESL